MSQTILLVDAFSIAFRAFYSYPPNLTLDDGTPANAVYGFLTLILKSIDTFEPDYVCVCFDRKEPTFRHEMYSDYKGHRTPPPDEFIAQIPYFRTILDESKIAHLDCAGFEADDIIGTLSVQATEKELKTLIMTGDHDALQLVNEHVSVIMNKKGVSDWVEYTPEKVFERYDFYPNTIVDYKALKGDPSDNIPGVKGVGDKTATTLLKEHGSLTGIYENLEAISSKSVQKKLNDNKENAYLSQKLATINCDVPVQFLKEDMAFETQWNHLKGVFQKYKFNSLISKYKSKFTQDDGLTQPIIKPNLKSTLPVKGLYQLIESVDVLDLILPIMKKGFAIDLETTDLHVHNAQIVGVAFAVSERKAFYIPLNESVQIPSTDANVADLPMFSSETKETNSYKISPLLERLIPLLEDPSIPKYTHNGKYEIQVLKNYGIQLKGIAFDTLIAAYLLYPGERLGLKDLVEKHFDFKMTQFEDLLSEKSEWNSFLDVPLNKALSVCRSRCRFYISINGII